MPSPSQSTSYRGRLSSVLALALLAVLVCTGSAHAGTSLYVAERNGAAIHQLSINAAGDLTPVASFASPAGPWGVAISPDKRSLYAASNGTNSIAQFTINQSTGALTPKASASVPSGGSPSNVVVSPDGQSVYATNRFGPSISQYDVAADGSLSAKTVPTVAAGAQPERLVIAPDGASLYSVDRGANPRTIRQYSIDSQGQLTPKTPATVASPGRPEGLAVNAAGTSLYATSSFGSTLITQWNITPVTGLLTAKTPATAPGAGNTGGIVLSPDGQRAYVSEGDGVTMLSYDLDSGGRLTQRPGPGPSFAGYPLDTAMSPAGNALYLTSGSTVTAWSVAGDGSLVAKTPPTTTFPSTVHGMATLVLPDPVPAGPGAPPAGSPAPPAAPTTAKPAPAEPADRVPTVPRSLRVTGGDRTLKLAFRAPAASGGRTISSYQVRIGSGDWKRVRTTGRGNLSARVTAVANGSRFTVRLRARNAVGAGPSARDTARTAEWFRDPLSAAQRRRLRAVPAMPGFFAFGPLHKTRAYASSYRGRAAMDIPALDGRGMQFGDAATLSDRGLFAFDSDRLTARGLNQVRLLVASLRYAGAVRCEGYTDYAAERDHELALSRGRARAVCGELRRRGAGVGTRAVGYGPDRPAVVGGTASSRELNRRVVVVVTR